ncbi:NADH-quinone oxidoreductase subunit C [Streptomyces sp. NPDC006733]|uniref:NADH-quinone oxidoreductase subunit C n=1 Tax=Streptomyces sp. NPDC006733 TaxID=3155460 RepID=UPI0033F7EF25
MTTPDEGAGATGDGGAEPGTGAEPGPGAEPGGGPAAAEPAAAAPVVAEPAVGWLPGAAAEIFGAEATAAEAFGLLTVDVPVGSWIAALEIARDKLGCTYFDWLSAVDEAAAGFRVCAHLVSLPGTAADGRMVRRLLVRTTVPHSAAALPTAVDVFAGAGWHERETHEMFGIDFTGHPHLVPLLLPDEFEGHPLRKDFVLAARVAKAWPGAKEPGESEHGGPKRRTMLPPGVPDPNEWGPLKGQLPPAPVRAARTPRAAAGAGAAAAGAERPARRPRPAAAQPDAPWQQPEATAAPAAPAAPAAESPPAPEKPARPAPAKPAEPAPEPTGTPETPDPEGGQTP